MQEKSALAGMEAGRAALLHSSNARRPPDRARIGRTAAVPGRIALSIDMDEWLAGQPHPGKFHKDPADRIIVATARKLAAPLVTADEKIRSDPHLRTIWPPAYRRPAVRCVPAPPTL